jgi:hypothetical protein
MAQVVECEKHGTLSSIPNTAKKKKYLGHI